MAEGRLKRRVKRARAKFSEARKQVRSWVRRRKHWRSAVRHRLRRLREWRQEHPEGFRPAMLNGHPGDISEACKDFIYRADKAGLYVTSTTGGTHAPNSYHYSGRAVDVAGSWRAMVDFQRAEARAPGSYYELFGPENYPWVRNGVIFAEPEGTALEQNHDTHVHGALR